MEYGFDIPRFFADGTRQGTLPVLRALTMSTPHPLLKHREELRLDALNRYCLLDTQPEDAFDRITKLAARRLRTPVAFVCLVDRERIWFKSRFGIDLPELPYVLEHEDLPFLPQQAIWVQDTRRSQSGFWRRRELRHLQFFAAAPLTTYHGYTLGSLCVMGPEPRRPAVKGLGELQDLATTLMRRIETRRLELRFRKNRSVFRPKRKAPSPPRPETLDPLTALPDRHTLLDRLDRLMEASRPPQGSLLLFDLEEFRRFNADHGYHTGDRLLVDLAQRLVGLRGPRDMAARLGSDEFALLLPEAHTGKEARRAQRTLEDLLARPFPVHPREVSLATRVCSVTFSQRHHNAEDILRDAEAALAERRQEPSGPVQLIRTTQGSPETKPSLREELQRALDGDELRLAYQPIVDLRRGRVRGFESLVRWQHPERGLLRPKHFLAAAADNGLLPKITRWTLGEACAQLARWRHRFPFEARWTVSVNVDSRALDLELAQTVGDLLRRHGLRGGDLNLEITEHAMVEGSPKTTAAFQAFRDQGIALHIDDFGTGFATLDYLRSLPGSTVKIDRSFVTEMLIDARQYQIVRSIVELAHNLHMKVVAEGIETEPLRRALADMGCDFGQGFFFSRPLTVERLEGLLESGALWLLETQVH